VAVKFVGTESTGEALTSEESVPVPASSIAATL